jgi:hypothetical protein
VIRDRKGRVSCPVSAAPPPLKRRYARFDVAGTVVVRHPGRIVVGAWVLGSRKRNA